MPSVYIETSIISYLTARRSNDIRTIANQNTTIEWWEKSRQNFQLFISEFVRTEASQGDEEASRRRLEVIENLPILEVEEETLSLAKAFIRDGPIHKKSEIDAYHISVSTVNGIDYLLTWNCTHIANAAIRPRIESICRKYGYEPPIICTPLELMED